MAHLVVELEAERARLTKLAVDLDEHRVRELRPAFEASPQECRAALRSLLAGEKLRVRADPEHGFAVEGFLEVEVPGSRSLAEPGRSGGALRPSVAALPFPLALPVAGHVFAAA